MANKIIGIDGNKVYTLRKEKLRISQEKLSEISGVSRTLIQRIEMNKVYECNLKTLNKLATALNVDPMELVDRGEKLNE